MVLDSSKTDLKRTLKDQLTVIYKSDGSEHSFEGNVDDSEEAHELGALIDTGTIEDGDSVYQ